MTKYAYDTEVLPLLDSLITLSQIRILKNTFIKSFYRTITKSSGDLTPHEWLHGSFNLGGTVSGRLSSSKPNLQNMPSTGTTYAKEFKRCISAPKGWLIVGADFNALEAVTDALITKDPNKLKVYTEGFDSHCLATLSYFSDQLPHIDPTDVEAVNSIKNTHEHLRQLSKPITFACQYSGTFRTLMANCGFDEVTAKKIEQRYLDLYAASVEWKNKKLLEASRKGYVEVAFGLKVRTPLLKKTVYGSSTTPREAIAEARTAGNSLSQSYGLLNNRSANEFMERVYSSQYKYDVHPFAHIHDSQYYIIKDNVDLLQWVNVNLIECMSWQELPELKHDSVKIRAELELFYPDLSNKIKIPNNLSNEDLTNFINKELFK